MKETKKEKLQRKINDLNTKCLQAGLKNTFQLDIDKETGDYKITQKFKDDSARNDTFPFEDIDIAILFINVRIMDFPRLIKEGVLS